MAVWLAGLVVAGCSSKPQSGPVDANHGESDGGAADVNGGAADVADPNACATITEDTDAGVGGGPNPSGSAGGIAGAPEVFARPIDMDDEYANRTEVMYLSGRGIDDAVPWRFHVTGGRNSCRWSTIPVPSQWEFHGFGTFRYGSEARTSERGVYQRSFDVPASWSDRRIFIAFEGVMTDASVKVNGISVGATHQGAFYRFKYDITSLVHFGEANQIEVTVAKESADASVNEAERQADYWVFGGIFRPVYLEAFPEPAVDRFTVDARADGSLTAHVFLRDVTQPGEIRAQLFDDTMTPVGTPVGVTIPAAAEQATVSVQYPAIKPWSAETPNRYRLAIELSTADGARHAVRENIGFRTIEVRAGDGIYVNGTKVMLRGLNRHSFWPESGRAGSPRLTRTDVELLKSMNANAVRSSHYPSDKHFYNAADALGLYVLDELAGWQAPPYGTEIGRKLIEEMVTFDVNHPSIIFWDNGNEGGWNVALDGDFARWDPQARPVLHPWALFGGIDTDHYESYTSTVSKLASANIFMPTEFLHGLYDGGGGAGLDDYWTAMRRSPHGAGGFIWALLDEGVLRADQGGQIDVKGNAAPDGVVGPYRQKEGSYYAIRQIWSPAQIALSKLPAAFTGAIPVENAYDLLDLQSLTFGWHLVRFDIGNPAGGHTIIAEGTATTGSIAPHATGTLQLPLPAEWSMAHALLLDATDATHTLVGQWSWMIIPQSVLRQEIIAATMPTQQPVGAAAAVDGGDVVTVSVRDSKFTFSKSSGQLVAVTAGGSPFLLRNGPQLSTATSTATAQTFTSAPDGGDHVISVTYAGDLQQVLWRVTAGGWLALTYRYSLAGRYNYFGVDFDYPEASVLGAQWLGRGPHRVYKNRMLGPWHDVWARDKNDAITGQVWNYPEFKGYFADISWVRLLTTEGPVLFVFDSADMFLRLFSPVDGTNPQTAVATFPGHDISFLHGISPIGDKFLAAAALGPQGQQHTLANTFEATVYMHFGNL